MALRAKRIQKNCFAIFAFFAAFALNPFL